MSAHLICAVAKPCTGGRQGTVPGLCTGAFVCMLLQWTYNELGILRVKFVSRSRHIQVAPSYEAQLRSTSPPASDLPGHSKPWSHNIFDSLGFRRISDDEYLAKMKATRDVYLRQIEVLEREPEEKRRMDSKESRDKA